MKAAKKVFYNTVFLYVKLVVTMVLTLYATRIVLKSLGVVDFGIFSLVAGIIAMLSFLNGAMTVTTQRYFSFFLGKNEVGKNREVFQTSVLLHLVIAFIIVLLLEGLYFFIFNGWLNIPGSRIDSAKWIYQFMVVSTFFTINSVPYDALINAHEDMLFDSVVGIIEALMRLGIAFYVLVTSYDKLITFGLLTAVSIIVTRIIKSVWCAIKYEDCRFAVKYHFKTKLLKEMSAYAGWNLFGALCSVASTQGIAIILNKFFGARINASYAIANQVNSQLHSFSVMMSKAINPQIMKSEGGGDRGRMIRLAIQSSKFSVFLLILMVVPIIVEMRFILDTWLLIIPDHAVVFCILILVNSIINQMSTGLKTAVQATGKIRLYQAVVGTTILLILPLAYILLSMGFPPYAVIIAGTCIEIVSLYLRLVIVKKITGLDIPSFSQEIIIKASIITVIAMVISYVPVYFMDAGFLRLALVLVISFLSSLLLIWKIGFNEYERNLLLELSKGLFKRLGWNRRLLVVFK